MKRIPKIADAELEIMNILWSNSPLTANQIVEALADRKSWDPRTAKTLINRLHKKAAVGFQKDGRRYLYFPLVSKRDYIERETKSFVSKFQQGMLGPVLSTFLNEAKLTDKELDELRQLLDEKGKG
jgi:BlaI family penicillinase repressor